ncbi:MAG: hypothetical protein QXZ62_07925, partial [Candidatus Caldarchaeum sp.]
VEWMWRTSSSIVQTAFIRRLSPYRTSANPVAAPRPSFQPNPPSHPTAFRKGWPPSTAGWVRVCVWRSFPMHFAGTTLCFHTPSRLEGMASGIQPLHGTIVPVITKAYNKHGFKRIGGVVCTVPKTL